jgi:adenylate cyclase
MRRAIAQINSARQRENETLIEVGIGIDSGEVVAGNVGSEKRLEYTLIGMPVNNAYYLSKLRPPDLFLTHNVCDKLPSGHLNVRARSAIAPKGATEPLPIYSVIDA